MIFIKDKLVFSVILIWLLTPLFSWGQDFHLTLLNPEENVQPEQYTFDNQPDMWSFLHDRQIKLQEDGFLASSLDSIKIKDTAVLAYVHQGPKYKWAKLDFSGIPYQLWLQLGILEKDWEKKPISPKKLAALHEKILNYCENNGYPFAYTYLSDFKHENEGITATLNLQPGDLQKIDSIVVQGEVSISLSYLENYLDIHQGSPYDESKLKKLHKRLNDLPFLEEAQPWRMDFSIAENKLYLYLKKKPANQINGLIGLQPNTQSTGKFRLTADFLLGLQNSLGYGETIEATYKNLEPESPQFFAHFIAPFLLGTGFGLEGSFDLYKKDSTYRRITLNIGLRYQFNADDFIKVFYENKTNRLIMVDTLAIRNLGKLPDNVDVSSHGAGVTFEMNRTDYKLNPRKGWVFNLTAVGSTRKLIANDAILALGETSGIDFQSLYDQANKDKLQYRLNGFLSGFLPIYKMIVGKLNYQGGYLHGKNLFQNELFQIGGFHSLRGFDENSFFANQYHIVTAEVHFNFGLNNYFYLFNDDAYVQTKFGDFNRKEIPISFGTGLNIENKTGIFNIALGIGKRKGEPFGFKNAKIHFGYAAHF